MNRQQCIDKANEILAERAKESEIMYKLIATLGYNDPCTVQSRHRVARMEREAQHWISLSRMHGNARNKIIRDGWTVI